MSNAEQIEYWNGKVGDIWVLMQERMDLALTPVTTALLAAANPQAGEFVRSNAHPHAGAADQHAPVDLPRRHRLCDERRIVGIIDARPLRRSEVDPLVRKLCQLPEDLNLNLRPAVIAGHAHFHWFRSFSTAAGCDRL